MSANKKVYAVSKAQVFGKENEGKALRKSSQL